MFEVTNPYQAHVSQTTPTSTILIETVSVPQRGSVSVKVPSQLPMWPVPCSQVEKSKVLFATGAVGVISWLLGEWCAQNCCKQQMVMRCQWRRI
ncbi:hypothetical protein IG631_13541 [Alternaria alternata]|nr:hypothetical protein IG631_13541 [Alternaria alternata]